MHDRFQAATENTFSVRKPSLLFIVPWSRNFQKYRDANARMAWAAEPHQREVQADRLCICQTCPTRRWKLRRSRCRVGSVVSGVQLVIAVIRYQQWLCLYDAVAHKQQHGETSFLTQSPKHFSLRVSFTCRCFLRVTARVFQTPPVAHVIHDGSVQMAKKHEQIRVSA